MYVIVLERAKMMTDHWSDSTFDGWFVAIDLEKNKIWLRPSESWVCFIGN